MNLELKGKVIFFLKNGLFPTDIAQKLFNLPEGNFVMITGNAKQFWNENSIYFDRIVLEKVRLLRTCMDKLKWPILKQYADNNTFPAVPVKMLNCGKPCNAHCSLLYTAKYIT